MSNYAIYKPKGAAQEYAEWACNFYVGCSNGCTYCYLKKGIGKAVLGGDKPTLKKCFNSEIDALKVFEHELSLNIVELQKHGLFFSFTTDPMLPETIFLTLAAIAKCIGYAVPVKILTKNAEFLNYSIFKAADMFSLYVESKRDIAFGFTLTGHDELETRSSTNAERIEAMKRLHDAGFKTFASIEPIIDFESSRKMIEETLPFCDLYKLGLESGKKYDREQLNDFIFNVIVLSTKDNLRVYFKDSMFKNSGYTREILPAECVNRDYNLFK
jgi:DNA repair photolyase